MLYLANNRLLLINNGNSLYRIEGEEPAPVGGDEFIFTIDTTSGTGDSFNLPLRSGYNYDFVVDWGDGNTNTITSYNQAEKLHTYSTGGEYTISITGLCEAWYFNNSGDRLKLISIEQWGNTGFRNMQNAFMGCSNLTGSTDSDGSWCFGVISMSYMFNGCSSLATLDVSNWDVSNVTIMQYMFSGCESLTELDVSKWDTSSVTNMGSMFYYCPSLTTLDVSTWDVSNVTGMSGMFNYCSSLTTLDVSKWNVSNVHNMNNMFKDCSSLTTLDVSSWDVSNVSYMSGMFTNTLLDTPSYDALLIGWSQLPSLKSDLRLDANLAKYSAGAAATARGILTSRPNNWRIYDGGPVV